MLRTDGLTRTQLQPLSNVVEEITHRGEVAPESLMVIGAACRDLLHAGFGHDFAPRMTYDYDLALATTDLAGYEELMQRFGPGGGARGVRMIVHGLSVDVVPFGDVEDPVGTVRTNARPDGLNVWGFREVFADSLPLDLGDGRTVRLPTPAGFVALKMAAWVDRSAYHDHRDGDDLALACHWYAEDADVEERLYATRAGRSTLELWDVDLECASAHVLGAEARAMMGDRAADIEESWHASPLGQLAERFGNPANSFQRTDLGRRRRVVDALSAGMWPRRHNGNERD